jgi:hypothetical protein
MDSSTCNHECNSGFCPFMADPYNTDRQVCLKCGHEHSFKPRGGNLWLIVALLASLFLMLNNSPKTPESTPKNEAAIDIAK